jgi:hypothetical protein
MGSKDPEFLSKIKMAWDNFFSTNPNLMLIIPFPEFNAVKEIE